MDRLPDRDCSTLGARGPQRRHYELHGSMTDLHLERHTVRSRHLVRSRLSHSAYGTDYDWTRRLRLVARRPHSQSQAYSAEMATLPRFRHVPSHVAAVDSRLDGRRPASIPLLRNRSLARVNPRSSRAYPRERLTRPNRPRSSRLWREESIDVGEVKMTTPLRQHELARGRRQQAAGRRPPGSRSQTQPWPLVAPLSRVECGFSIKARVFGGF